MSGWVLETVGMEKQSEEASHSINSHLRGGVGGALGSIRNRKTVQKIIANPPKNSIKLKPAWNTRRPSAHSKKTWHDPQLGVLEHLPLPAREARWKPYFANRSTWVLHTARPNLERYLRHVTSQGSLRYSNYAKLFWWYLVCHAFLSITFTFRVAIRVQKVTCPSH